MAPSRTTSRCRTPRARRPGAVPDAERAGPRSGDCPPLPRPRRAISHSRATRRPQPATPGSLQGDTGPDLCRPRRRARRADRHGPSARMAASATPRAGRRAGRRGGRRRAPWVHRARGASLRRPKDGRGFRGVARVRARWCASRPRTTRPMPGRRRRGPGPQRWPGCGATHRAVPGFRRARAPRIAPTSAPPQSEMYWTRR